MHKDTFYLMELGLYMNIAFAIMNAVPEPKLALINVFFILMLVIMYSVSHWVILHPNRWTANEARDTLEKELDMHPEEVLKRIDVNIHWRKP